MISIAKAYAGGSWIAVGNGTESDGQGIDRAGDQIGDPTIDAPADNNLPQAIDLPTYPGSRSRPRSTVEGGDRQADDQTRPRSRRRASRPDEPEQAGYDEAADLQAADDSPDQQRRRAKPNRRVATLQTAVGLIVGTVGSTVTELSKATTYCQAEMKKVTITHPTQEQLQKCVTAYQTGGAAAVDQVIRNLLSLLGLLGVLGGGIARELSTHRPARLPPPLPRRAPGDATEHLPPASWRRPFRGQALT